MENLKESYDSVIKSIDREIEKKLLDISVLEDRKKILELKYKYKECEETPF